MTEARTFISTAEARKFISRGYLRWLNTSSDGINHEATLYEIKSTAPLNNFTRCDDCEEKGKFLFDEKDHKQEHSITILCKEHSPEYLFEVLNSRNSA